MWRIGTAYNVCNDQKKITECHLQRAMHYLSQYAETRPTSRCIKAKRKCQRPHTILDSFCHLQLAQISHSQNRKTGAFSAGVPCVCAGALSISLHPFTKSELFS